MIDYYYYYIMAFPCRSQITALWKSDGRVASPALAAQHTSSRPCGSARRASRAST